MQIQTHKEECIMKLQAALDTLTLEECLALLDHTKGAVDIAEVGTPFIIDRKSVV